MKVSIVALCALLAWGLARFAHVDPLTAYLATSPGGLDSAAIIAASTPRVDLSFVLALQSVRLLFVIGLAPLIARLVVRYSPHLQELRHRKTRAIRLFQQTTIRCCAPGSGRYARAMTSISRSGDLLSNANPGARGLREVFSCSAALLLFLK